MPLAFVCLRQITRIVCLEKPLLVLSPTRFISLVKTIRSTFFKKSGAKNFGFRKIAKNGNFYRK